MIQLLVMISKDKSHLCVFHSVWKNPADYFVSLGEHIIIVKDILLVRSKYRDECESHFYITRI